MKRHERLCGKQNTSFAQKEENKTKSEKKLYFYIK